MQCVSVSAAGEAAAWVPELGHAPLQNSRPLRTTRRVKVVAADLGSPDRTDQIQRSVRNVVGRLLIQSGCHLDHRPPGTEEARSRVVETWV